MSGHCRWIAIIILSILPTPLAAWAGFSYSSDGMTLSLDTDAGRMLPAPDSLAAPESVRHIWKDLLFTHRLDINDTTVIYPKFIDFCIRVYRWYDRNFSTYDPAYVEGIGKHGKLRLVSDNWMNAYYFRTHDGVPIIMASNPYSNLGFAVNYYALSYGYSWDVTTVFHGAKSYHKKHTLSFTSSRLFADGYYWINTGTTKLKGIGNDKTGSTSVASFDGINFKAMGIDGIYVFNYNKFCYGAAYNLSHHQIKSQGSWMLGLSWSMYDCRFDFSKLIEDTFHELELPNSNYRFKYNTFSLTGGYSYNWVLGKHWLYNITLLPSIGMTASQETSTTGHKMLPGMSIKGKAALNYINRQFFISLTGNANSNFFLSNDLRFISGIFYFQASTGIRF